MDLLTAGIDENFIRPVPPSKLLDYLKSRFGERDRQDTGSADPDRLHYAGLELDPSHHSARYNGSHIHLSFLEFKLLLCLMRQQGRVCSREQLLEAGWRPGQFVDAKTLVVHIARLRRALMASGAPDYIQTVRSTGYVLGRLDDAAGTEKDPE